MNQLGSEMSKRGNLKNIVVSPSSSQAMAAVTSLLPPQNISLYNIQYLMNCYDTFSTLVKAINFFLKL